MTPAPSPAGRQPRRRFSFARRSLATRVIAFSTVWAVVALVAISTVIATLYRQTSERSFDSLLSAHLFNLIGSVGVSPAGTLTGSPDLGDLRFSEPVSGWYWSVEPVSEGLLGRLQSLSMTRTLAAPDTNAVPFNASFQRNYLMTGIDGEELEVFESEFVLDAKNRVARFRVMGNRSELDEEVAAFEWRLFTYLALFGLGMVAINVAAMLLALRPLSRVREALSQVREGTAQRLDGSFPAEIEPLAAETNALIENNRRIVERARTQVGNLAHSLKTPLAVVLNEARAIGGAKGQMLAEQATAMQSQLDHYLKRARIAAQRESVVFRTPVAPLLDRLVRVMRKLSEGMNLEFEAPPADIVFAGEREDLEEIVGNLLENAMKWGSSRVRLSVLPQAAGDDPTFLVVIEDDGPGIPEDKARDALGRGHRLDEAKPGTGLGLAIVSDLVKEYGGQIDLGRSALGGLRAQVRLRSTR